MSKLNGPISYVTHSEPKPMPTPEDPRENEPVRDPPVYPDQDIDADRVRRMRGSRGVGATDPSPEAVVD